MDPHSLADPLSDEEIFIGRLTLGEIKKRLISAAPVPITLNHRQSLNVYKDECTDDINTSIKIIETHSAPDITLQSGTHPTAINKSESTPGLSPETFCDWNIKADDSFLRLEKMVDSMVSVQEVQENIGTKKYFSTNNSVSQGDLTNKISQETKSCDNKLKLHFENVNELQKILDEEQEMSNIVFKTPMKNNFMNKSKLPDSPNDMFMTPSAELKSKESIFKTPVNPSHKKHSAIPRKYQNVASPVAAYIRNSPQVPLLRDVCPKKPLPGVSSIPKPLKHFSQLNKENIKQECNKPPQQEKTKLPAVAYRNAKETKMINIPDENKMPQSQWAKQVASAIPRAFVVKHSHRETSSTKKFKQPSQENSFADLSLHQADLSVCTQKHSFSKPKKNI